MGAGIFNVLMGIVAIVSGLGGAVLPFTSSSEALIGVGGAITALGLYQIVRARAH